MKLRGRSLIVSVVLMLTSSVPSHGADDVTLHIAGRQTPITITAGNILTFSPDGLLVTQQNNVVDQASYGTVTLGPKRDAVHVESDGQGQGNSSGNPINVIVELPTVVINYPDPEVISVIPQITDISTATITVYGKYSYTGSRIEPQYIVKYGTTELTKGTDYTAEITNNINVTTSTSKATISVTGKGDYNGTARTTFEIDPVMLTVTAKDTSMVYGDKTPELTYAITGFVGNEDKSVLTKLPVAQTNPATITNVGDYDIIVSGGEARNYGFTYVSGKLTVTEKDLSNAILSFSDSCVYTGYAIEPAPSVTLDSIELVADKDFKLSYANNVEPSDSARMIVTGIGNYKGEIDTTFVIYMVQTTEVRINGELIKGVPDSLDSKKLTFQHEWGTAVVANAFVPELNKTTLTVTATDTTLISHIYRNETTLVFPETENGKPAKTYEGSYYIPLSGKVVIDITFVIDSVAVGIYDLEELETSYVIYNTRGQMVERGKALGHQDVLDRVKHQPQGLYIIKLNNKTFKVYRK